jgi:hypothetical protein
MSATTQVTDFSDLYTDLQNRTREETGVTATDNQAKRYINIALQDMHLGFAEKFPWAERTARLTTQPRYTTGTLAITVGTTTIAGTDTLWNTNNDYGVANMRANGKLQISGGNDIYTIASVGSDTAGVLSETYVGDTETAASYVYFEDEYSLASDFLRPLDARTFDGGEIELLGRTEFRRRYPRNYTTGRPNVATILDYAPSGNTTPLRRVQFHPAPDVAYTIPYSYVTSNLVVASDGTAQANFAADADEPIVPLRYRHAIVFHALYHWYRDKKDDQRAQLAKTEYTDMMLRIVGDSEIGSSRPSFRPRIAPYRSRASQPWSSTGKRYDLYGRFDRLES